MPRGWKTALRIAAALLFVGVAVTTYVVDARYKHWPDNGYAIPDPGLTIASEDFPGFWQGLLDTTAGRGVSQALSRQIGDLERQVRLTTGVRPTPARWSFWLGDEIMVSRKAAHWMACVRPGLLFRMLDGALQWVKKSGNGDSNLIWEGVWGTWKDGYLLLSDRPTTISDIVPAAEVLSREAAPTLRVSWRNVWPDGLPMSAQITLTAGPDLPVTTAFSRTPITPRQPLSWPALRAPESFEDTIMDCYIEDLNAYENISLLPLLADLDLNGYLALLPGEASEWLADTPFQQQTAMHGALFDLDCSTGTLIPHAGVSLFRPAKPWREHPFLIHESHPPAMRVPYAWDDVNGFLLPFLGKDYTFGCAVQGNWAHTANPGDNLRPLLIDESSAARPAPAFRATVRWDLLADAITAWLRQRQQLKLLPGDPRAFDVDYGCWTDAMRALGKARIASVDDAPPEMLTLRGDLAIREGATP